ncbi:MAG TPA: hypothetical protein VM677_03030 [Actinokineospora sp.]|nr:hypothetical protein [Actinokineospora sp.]
MDLSGADFDNIPRGNLRVQRVEFARVWLAAECESDAHPSDWRLAGVVMTCRWIATATVRPESGPWRMARSPVTERTDSAHEELIEAECLAAELLAMRRPVPDWVANRPGWIDAVVATLNWAWRRSGVLPITVAPAR